VTVLLTTFLTGVMCVTCRAGAARRGDSCVSGVGLGTVTTTGGAVTRGEVSSSPWPGFGSTST
jgi:hypothetical protein